MISRSKTFEDESNSTITGQNRRSSDRSPGFAGVRKILIGCIFVPVIFAAGFFIFLQLRPSFAGVQESICYGGRTNGSLEFGWQLPSEGKNFRAYSLLGWASGRTYVHSKVYQVIVDSYSNLHTLDAAKVFVYGESGWPDGGKIRPHRTHQNGLSVDFMVPVLDDAGGQVPLPSGPHNLFGYGVDFDDSGKSGELTIDFEAIASHLAALKKAAKNRGVKISKVIFAPALQKHLRQTAQWKEIRSLPFSKKPVWVRHDDHYHVDFSLPCKKKPKP